jgi:transposase
MKIATIGVDLAKTVLQVHGVDKHGKVGLRKQLKRKDVVSFFANLEPSRPIARIYSNASRTRARSE